MRIAACADYLVTRYNNLATRKRTVMFIGKSGVGKSDSVRQAVTKLGIAIYDMRLSTSDPTNFGMLMPENGTMVRIKPDFISFMEQHPDGGILLLDELTSAPPAIQAPAYQVTLDRACNGFSIPDTWMVVGTGNHATDRGVTFNIAAPLMARMNIINVETTVDDFIAYGAKHGCNPLVLAFVHQFPHLLHRFDTCDHGKPFPNPRSYMAVSDLLSLGLPPALRVESIAGDIGVEAAGNFEEFTRVYETIPSLERIFTAPEEVDIPARLDVRYCLAMGIATRLDKKNFATAWRYIKRMDREFQSLIGSLAYHRDSGIASSPAFAEWAVTNKEAWATNG